MEVNRKISSLIDKIFVLTIERNQDRHPNVRSIFKDLDFEFWYGLDAKETFVTAKYVCDIEDEFFDSNNIDKNYVCRLTLGQFGAYYSIKRMINYFSEKNMSAVVSFEDDIKALRTDWKDILMKAMNELPTNWDLLLLGYNYDGSIYKLNYNRKFRFIIKKYYWIKQFLFKKSIPKSPVRFSRHLDISGFSMGGHAYCVSRKGAHLLNEYLTPMRASGDILFSELILEHKINAFSVYPCLFAQDGKFGSKTMMP